MRHLSLLLLLALLACPDPAPPADDDDTVADDDDATDDDDAVGEVEAPVYSGEWTAPSWAVFDALPLARDDAGRVLVSATPEVVHTLNPTIRDAVTSAAGCGALIAACYDPSLRNYAGCFDNVPACAGDRPWEDAPDSLCCAPACADRYRELRRAGASEPQAAIDAIRLSPSCMPGVDAQVGSAP